MFRRKKKQEDKTPPVLDLRQKRDAKGSKAVAEIPAGTEARHIIAAGRNKLLHVPDGLRCHTLDLSGTSIEYLPDDIEVSTRLDLSDCKQLVRLPANLKTGSLILRDCTALEQLPPGLQVSFLDVQGCRSLREIPADLSVNAGRLNLRDCAMIRTVPAGIGPISQLDVAGCVGMKTLPEGLVVHSWVDMAGTAITQLPESMQGVQIRWRSVLIDERIAFRPEELSVDEILNDPNAERRRVKLERFGFEKFMEAAEADLLDTDTDAGGPRKLLRVPIEDDEDLVCVSVICPSTDRHYLIRVPPTMRTCRQAVAWTAGFDDADAYNPVVET